MVKSKFVLIYLIISFFVINVNSINSNDSLSGMGDSKETMIEFQQNLDRIDSANLFYSQVIQANLEIFISLPSNYYVTEDQYSTIYLLDADWYFNESSSRAYDKTPMENGVAGIIQKLVIKDGYKDAILIGVGYPDETMRGRDFWSKMDDFHLFLKSELVPYIDQNYHTSEFRSLIGHSSGGNYVLYDLLQYPHTVFQNYVALSWVFYPDNTQLVKAMDILVETYVGIKFNVSFYLGVGLNEPDRFLTSFDKLLTQLEPMQFTYFKFKSQDYKGLDHGSIVGPGFTDGLEWIYRDEPYASFSVNSTQIKTGEKIKFTFIGHEGTQPSYFTWDFGDNSAISQEHDPVHEFEHSGSYQVILAVNNNYGSHSTSILVNVTENSKNFDFVNIAIISSITLGSVMLLVIIRKYSPNTKKTEIQFVK